MMPASRTKEKEQGAQPGVLIRASHSEGIYLCVTQPMTAAGPFFLYKGREGGHYGTPVCE